VALKLGKLQREDGDSAGALDQHGCPGLEIGAGESVESGNTCAGKCCGFVVTEVVGDPDEAGFLQQDVFGECAVDVAAERAFDIRGSGRPIEPVLHENAADAIARLEGRNTLANGGNFAGAVGAGDARQAEFGVVGPGDHHEVAIVERDGMNFNQHFSAAGRRSGAFNKLKRINAEGWDLPDAHGLQLRGRIVQM